LGRPQTKRLCVVFVSNVDWFFLSHRLPLARAMSERGARVVVVAADTGKAAEVRAQGLEFVSIPLSRQGRNIASEIRTLAALLVVYRRLQPDLLHHITIKPILYGALAARFSRKTRVVNAITGLGWIFSRESPPTLLRRIVIRAYRAALNAPRSKTIFQNPEDRDELVKAGLVARDRTVLIRGAGVDCERFRPVPEPDGTPLVLLASRLLWEKGIAEFVGAARLLRERGVIARFVLVGSADDANPTALTHEELANISRDGLVEWWGSREDMPDVIAQATIVTLPTFYREGLPKILLEGAAGGRPLVATDIPGCREIVRNEINGLLIPTRDVVSLADALQRLLTDPLLRRKFGIRSREIAENEFSERIVVEETLRVYDTLLVEGTG